MEQLILANDLGYGTIKAYFDHDRDNTIIPSVISVLRNQDITKPVTFKTKNDEKQYVNHLLDHLQFSVSSPVVQSSQRMLFGQAAINSGLALKQFDVNDLAGKADNDLALILTLAMIAGKTIMRSYENDHQLQSDYQVSVTMVTALPIIESQSQAHLNDYQHRFTDNKHVVTVYNFSEVIPVTIRFKQVVLAMEGEAAQYALRHADNKLQQMISDDFKKHYPQLAKEVTINDLITDPNVLGIDIGEGTTDYAVFTDDEINVQGSSSINNGYGNALEEALVDLRNHQIALDDRAALNEQLSKTVTPLTKGRLERIHEAVDEQVNNLDDAITNQLSSTLRKNSNIEVIFVYGGGAIALVDNHLRDDLTNKTKNFNGGEPLPVIWITKPYARYLNLLGLRLIAGL